MGNPSKIVCGELIISLFYNLGYCFASKFGRKIVSLLKKRVIFDFIY